MRNRVSLKYLLFILLFYTFLFNEPLTSVIPLFQYEDELFAVVAIPIWFLRVGKRKNHHTKIGVTPYIVGFVLCALLGSLIYKYQPFVSVVLPDLLISVKFWLCIYTGAMVFRNFDILKYAKKLYTHIKVVSWIYFLLSILNMITGVFSYYDYRLGWGANALFYSHPTVLVGCCSLLFAMIIAIKPYVKYSFFYMAILSAVMVTTLRAKALADVLIFGLVYYLITVKKHKFSIKSLLPLVPIVAFVGWSQVDYYFVVLREGSARAQLLLKSFQVAKDYFPFGAGFGTYGSHYSAIYYSPLYYKYGLHTIYGLSENLYSFICDSFWPMILGQSGYLGTVLYVIALIKFFQELSKLKKVNLFFYASAVGIMGYLLVESIAATAFIHPLSMPLAMWIGVLFSNAYRISKV